MHPQSLKYWDPHLDGGFPSDVGDKEVHGNVLTVDVFIHHISDGLGHHVRIQVGIILSGVEKESHNLLECTVLWLSAKIYMDPGAVRKCRVGRRLGVMISHRITTLGSWSQRC